MQKFKVRCSSLGLICAKKGFAKTGMTEVEKQVQNIIYNRRSEIKSPYLDKGNICEQESVDFLNKKYGTNIEKNTQRFYNDYIHGEPDFIDDTIKFVTDIKNSFDHQTFPLFTKVLDHNYEWQTKGYIWLLKYKYGSVDYFLNDMPEELIDRLAWQKCNKLGLAELDETIWNEVKELYTFSHLPEELRYKRFDVELKDEDIDFMIENTTKANDYGNQLLEAYYDKNHV